MNSFSCRNLKEFCRICLSSLVERIPFGSNATVGLNFDLSLIPQLKKLLVIFTSVDDPEEYPQKVCQFCYGKLLEFQEFRRRILESTQKIEDILKIPRSNPIFSKNHHNDNEGNQIDDDDNLLLPELVTTRLQLEWSQPEETKTELTEPSQFEIQVKNEIDSEFEEDDNDCQFYEENALSSVQNLPNNNGIGDKESTCNNVLFNATSDSNEQGKKTNTSRKRDRNKKSLKCPRCDKQVYKKVYLDAHIRAIHEGHEKPFLCNECQKCFTRYNHLHDHMQNSHTGVIKFACDIAGCDATFKMKQTLETHRRVAHMENQISTPFALEEIIGIHQQQLVREYELDHICMHCFKKFSSKRALTEHLKRHSEIREHVCKVCGVAKVTKTELQTHMRTHDANLEKFKCSLCPQEFNHKNAISRHVRVVHQGERRHSCSFCSRRFGTRHAKTSHERLHTGERPFKCTSCHKGFTQVEGLNSHMKNHDKSLRKHVCKYCAQRFITRKNLIDHEQRHLGNKPHICTTCSRGFFNRADLDLHVKGHVEELKMIRKEQIKQKKAQASNRTVDQVKKTKPNKKVTKPEVKKRKSSRIAGRVQDESNQKQKTQKENKLASKN